MDKYLRIIADEVTLSGLISALQEAQMYANGEIDVYEKFSYILSDGEKKISSIKEEVPLLDADKELLFNLWDDHYYYDYDSYDDFLDRFIKSGDYERIIRNSMLVHYREMVEFYSQKRQAEEVCSLNTKIVLQRNKINDVKKELSLIEKLTLERLRSKMRSSPSLSCIVHGMIASDGILEGLSVT